MAGSVLLLRHATHADLGLRLSGRAPGGGLTPAGHAQAAAAGRTLAGEPLKAIYSSPQLRARQTADAVARHHGVPVIIEPALDEIDFGEWTGVTFASLDGDPVWNAWNSARSSARCPDGESMHEAVSRAETFLLEAMCRHPGEMIAAVTHCDIIRGLLCWQHRRSLDDILMFDAEPASVTRIELGTERLAVAC